MTSHHSYKVGLWQFGCGTGVYTPASQREQRESVIQSAIMKAIAKEYPTAYMVKNQATQYGKAGTPDLSIVIDGVPIWIEVKRPGADTTALQVKALEKLRVAGAMCGTANSVETALQLIREALTWKTYVT